MTDEDWLLPKRKSQVNLNKKTQELYSRMGWVVIPTQWYDARTQRSHDLMGFGDQMMWIPGVDQLVVVQTTDTNHRADRVRKILRNKNAYLWLKACASRHIWVVAWKMLVTDVQDKNGRISKRRIWAYEPKIIDERDFNLCLGDSDLDALSLDVQHVPSLGVDVVPSMVEPSNGSDGVSQVRPLRPTLSIVRGHGEE